MKQTVRLLRLRPGWWFRPDRVHGIRTDGARVLVGLDDKSEIAIELVTEADAARVADDIGRAINAAFGVGGEGEEDDDEGGPPGGGVS
jgi:hypothetical protein